MAEHNADAPKDERPVTLPMWLAMDVAQELSYTSDLGCHPKNEDHCKRLSLMSNRVGQRIMDVLRTPPPSAPASGTVAETPAPAARVDLRVTVNDPHGMINHLCVAHQSSEAIILFGDMSPAGKRAEVRCCGGWRYLLQSDPERGEHSAEIELHGVPDDMMEIDSGIGRYTLFISLVSRKAMAASLPRPVYESPERAAALAADAAKQETQK